MIVSSEKCYCCGSFSDFTIHESATLLREASCTFCGASIRNSDVAQALLENYATCKGSLKSNLFDFKELKILLVASSGFLFDILGKLPNCYFGEFFPNAKNGDVIGGVKFLDLQDIDYSDGFFDIIVSEDVLEHIENISRAFTEINRVLKIGGTHIFSVPLHEQNVTTYRHKNKNIVHHGDPVRPEGVLVYNDFGYDLSEVLDLYGMQTKALAYHVFHTPEETTRVDDDYEKYLNNLSSMECFFKYNSVVYFSKKIKNCLEHSQTPLYQDGFTGERMIPGLVDNELELEHTLRYYFAQQFVTDKIVLDAACGEGYGSAHLAKKAKSVVGIDISSNAVEHAQMVYQAKNLEYKICGVEALNFENNFFDVIVSFETIEHVASDVQELFLQEIKRTLKDDGLLVISTPNHDVYKERGENHFHVKELTEKEFILLLSENFKFVKIYNQKHEVSCLITSEIENEQSCNFEKNTSAPEYMIAVCSNSELPESNAVTASWEVGSYKKLLDWAVSLHYSDIDKQKHINHQNSQLSEYQELIASRNLQLNEYQELISSQSSQLSEYEKSFDHYDKEQQNNYTLYKERNRQTLYYKTKVKKYRKRMIGLVVLNLILILALFISRL